ncbi:LysR family transcriptional regulator [Rhizomicrobium electricum]|uniref:LysR family transcriptional regulator n=1 Tax=Rhizomicrobium electricum TaxID=480070 RepID=A0ABN1EDW3_9PROT|nr:LysR family transcriptional regulator [Rhizomicrobium electricum]NIJ48709.1 DNA-binding transcriptional LysR family regulator [Rhizomicrobium electricum]
MDWDKLRIFHAVASAGSFTHAGQMLTLSQSAVSRQISALEEEINTPLFQRHARGLTLTDEGEMLYAAVSDVLARLAQAEEALKNVHDAPRGSLKVTSTHGIGSYWLVPRLANLMKECPELELHLVLEDRELDLSQREADVAIRMRAPVQADLIQRKLFTVHYHVYATQAYLDAAGTPQRCEDLIDHTVISYGETAPSEVRDINWLADQCKRAGRSGGKGRIIRVNNVTGVLNAALADIGVVSIPDYVAAQYSQLIRILPEIPGPSFDVHLVYADSLRQSKRVAAFRDFLVREAKDWHY